MSKSLVRSIARMFGFGSAQFTSKVEPYSPSLTPPRLMLEVRGRNQYGIGLLYVPDNGLFYVSAEPGSVGVAHRIVDWTRCTVFGNGTVVCPNHNAPHDSTRTITFRGAGEKATYYPAPDTPVTLTELPEGKFSIEPMESAVQGALDLFQVRFR